MTKAHKPSLLALPDPVGNRTVTNTTGRAVAEARHPWHSKRVRFATVPRCDVEPCQIVGTVCLSATVSLPPAVSALTTEGPGVSVPDCSQAVPPPPERCGPWPRRPFLLFVALSVSSGDADETQYHPEAENSAVACQCVSCRTKTAHVWEASVQSQDFISDHCCWPGGRRSKKGCV